MISNFVKTAKDFLTSLLYKMSKIIVCHVIVVTWARVICLIYTHDTQGRAVPEGDVDISGKSRVRML